MRPIPVVRRMSVEGSREAPYVIPFPSLRSAGDDVVYFFYPRSTRIAPETHQLLRAYRLPFTFAALRACGFGLADFFCPAPLTLAAARSAPALRAGAAFAGGNTARCTCRSR